MRGSMAKRLRPRMRSSTPLLSSTPPPLALPVFAMTSRVPGTFDRCLKSRQPRTAEQPLCLLCCSARLPVQLCFQSRRLPPTRELCFQAVDCLRHADAVIEGVRQATTRFTDSRDTSHADLICEKPQHHLDSHWECSTVPLRGRQSRRRGGHRAQRGGGSSGPWAELRQAATRACHGRQHPEPCAGRA